MNELFWLIALLLPVLMIVGIYRLLARLTARKSTKYSGKIDETQVKKERVFRD